MAKSGLDYFPFKTDFFDDIKVRKLIKYQGCKAVPVYTLLLCKIYKNGYYMMWDKELPFIISETTGYEEGYINEVIKCCVSVELLSPEMHSKGVLTSKGIQERYQDICRQAKRKANVSEYSLISPEETPKNPEEAGKTPEDSPQRKVKESKGNKSKKKGREENAHAHNHRRQILKKSKQRQRQKKAPSPGCAPPLSPDPAYINPAIAALLPRHIDQIGEEAKKDPWILEWATRQGIKPENIAKLLDDFTVHCKDRRKDHQTLKAYQDHLANWYPKRNNNVTQRSNPTGNRPTAAVIPPGRRDYGKP